MKKTTKELMRHLATTIYAGIVIFVSAFLGYLEGTSSIVFLVLFLTIVIEHYYVSAVNRKIKEGENERKTSINNCKD